MKMILLVGHVIHRNQGDLTSRSCHLENADETDHEIHKNQGDHTRRSYDSENGDFSS